ncbi:MAG: hypothetical protein SOZ84_01760 [Treponema sp.]|nr:hypothetical protein [Treponema sp.]
MVGSPLYSAEEAGNRSCMVRVEHIAMYAKNLESESGGGNGDEA